MNGFDGATWSSVDLACPLLLVSVDLRFVGCCSESDSGEVITSGG